MSSTAFSATVDVRTGDGLSVGLDGETGQVLRVRIGSKDVPLLAGALGGFSVAQFSPSEKLPNLLPNGSLEEMEGDNPRGWQLTGEHVLWDSTRNHTPGGKVSGKVGLPKEANREHPANSGGLVSEPIPANPNTLYYFSAWGMIGEQGSGGKMIVHELDSELKLIPKGNDIIRHPSIWSSPNVDSYAKWVRRSCAFLTSPECRFLRVSAFVWQGWGEFWADDVQLSLMPAEEEYLKGRLDKVQDGFRQQFHLGRDRKVLMDVCYESRPGCVLVRADIRDESPPAFGRALRFTFSLPVDIKGWWWHDDIQTKKRIEGNAIYKSVETLPLLEYSVYPVASVANNYCGLALAVPMDEPRIQNFHYDSKFGLCTTFDIGLSPLTTKIGPGKASFSFLIFHHEPAWGFRAAMKRYYEFFPQFFTKRVKQEGLWFYSVPIKPIANPEDFGLAFWAGYRIYKPDRMEREYARSKGMLISTYSSPWELTLMIPREARSSYKKMLSVLQEAAQHVSDKNLEQVSWENPPPVWPRQEVAQAALNSLPVLDDERPPMFWPWRSFFLNTDADLPEPNWALTWKKYFVESFLPEVDGFYFDNVTPVQIFDYMNFRPEHFAAADIPPSFCVTTGTPALPGLFSHYEFMQWLIPDLHAQGKFVSMNLYHDAFRYFAHFGDVIGSEVGAWGVVTKRNLANVEKRERCNIKRTLAYQKPVCNLLQEGSMEFPAPDISHEQVEEYIKHHLFYGFWPGINSLGSGKQNSWESHRYFARPDQYERDRDLFKRYIPVLRRICQAGWEPVTYATTSDPEVFIERFGYWEKGNLHFTIRNSAPEERKATVKAELAKLEEGKTHDVAYLVVQEVISGARLPARASAAPGEVEFDINLKGYDTTVVSVKSESAERLPEPR